MRNLLILLASLLMAVGAWAQPSGKGMIANCTTADITSGDCAGLGTGTRVYDTTLGYEVTYDGTSWVASGGATGDVADITASGTVTATNFVSPPADDEGGSIVMYECENDPAVPGGTNCPAVGAANTATIKLPDDSNPLNTDKEFLPGKSFIVHVGSNVAAIAGGFCGRRGTGASLQCTQYTTLSYETSVPFVGGVYVGQCLVYVAETTIGAGLIVRLRAQVGVDGVGVSDLGTSYFEIKHDAESCAGVDYCANTPGTYVWDVDTASTGASGVLQIEVDAASSSQVQWFSVECEYM